MRRGKTRSCGCLKRDGDKNRSVKIIPLNSRFGLLTVIERGRTIKNQARWVCRCDCGSTVTVVGVALRTGNTKSCGHACLSARPDKTKYRALRMYQAHANNRGLSWLLSDDEFFALCEQECHYCGNLPSNFIKPVGKARNGFLYSGIDRIDSSLGYKRSNCVPCCKLCNVAKMDRDYDEFVAWIHRASAHLKESNTKEA